MKSGEKFVNELGVRAIKDGVKRRAHTGELTTNKKREPKPPWLRVRLGGGKTFAAVRDTVHQHGLATVCEESHCPNIGECWSNGTATIMLMGSVCTRACAFCAVDTGNPQGRLNPAEPAQAAESVRLMKLKYVVLTSVDRDDLPDGGAAHYAACVASIRRENPQTAVEALTPDFAGNLAAVRVVVSSGLQVFAQNLETVERLTQTVRDRRAGYQQTLDVLRFAKTCVPAVLTKSSLMLGLGENPEEIINSMKDLRDSHVDILTLGQYLRPTSNHLPVARWVPPEEFDHYAQVGREMGFVEVASGPLVRSSYRADRILDNKSIALSAGRVPLKAL